MADMFTVEKRSSIMSSIRSTGTKPEALVIRITRKIHRRFQTNSKRLPGIPDLAFFRLKRVVFVHGCFWHQHTGCRRSNIPKSRIEYWGPKLQRNVARDRANRRQLHRLGWKTMVIWECQCKDVLRLFRRLVKFLEA
jgi:DNA mismatch endonuclease (patch repair protein)